MSISDPPSFVPMLPVDHEFPIRAPKQWLESVKTSQISPFWRPTITLKILVEPLTAASEMLAVTLAHSRAKKSFGAVPRLARQNSLKVSVCIACVAATRIALHFLLALVCFRSEAKFMNFRFFYFISSYVKSPTKVFFSYLLILTWFSSA